MPDYVVLLRAIGPGNSMPMADLRSMCLDIGLEQPETYIASGNLIVSAKAGESRSLVKQLESAIQDRFDLAIEVVTREADDFRGIAAANPFEGDPVALSKMVHLGLSNGPPAPDLIDVIRAKAVFGERVERVGDALWIDYGEAGAGRSKITPSIVNRAAGFPVTQRNLNTVRKLINMLDAR